MRLFLYLLWIIIVLIGTAFALLNSTMVPINYFFGTNTLYFPLLLLLILVVGVLLGVLALVPTIIKLKMKSHDSK